MKKKSLIILTFLFLIISVVAQENKISIPDEIMELKKEISTNLSSDSNFYQPSSEFELQKTKSTTADYGDTPNWDWVEKYGGSGLDIARQIAVAEDGALYYTGSFSGEISVSSNNYSSVGRRDAFLAKFQANGTLVWFQQFSPLAGEKIDAYSVHLDGSGNAYFTGYFTGDVSFGDIDLPGYHPKNLFFVKTNPDGEVTMAVVQPSFNPEEIGLKIDTDSNGNIFILGSADGTTNFRHKSVVSKYAPDGSLLIQYYHDQGWADMQIVNDNIYFTGTFVTADYIGDFYLEPRLYNDAFAARSNTNLDFSWAEIAHHGDATNGDSRGLALYVSVDEHIFLLGDFRSNVHWGDFELTGMGGFVAKCSSEGDFLWATTIDDVNEYRPFDISGNSELVFVSTVHGIANNITNEIKAFSFSNGALISSKETDYPAISINCKPSDNALYLTHDAEELIGLARLNDNTLENEWSMLLNGNSAYAFSIGMDMDQYGYMYNFGYASHQIDYFDQSMYKGTFLTKHNSAGSVVWSVQFQNSDEVDYYIGNRIVVDSISNNIHHTGLFFEPLIIPGGPTLVPDVYGSIFILKFDYNGNFIWAKQEDFRGDQLSITCDPSGNVLLSGTFNVPINVAGTDLVPVGYDDVFIAKYNASGEHMWAIRAGGEDTEWNGLLSTDSENNIYLTGEFTSVDVTINNFAFTMEEGDGNILIAKLDQQGNTQWATAKAGSAASQVADYYAWPTGIHTDADGYSTIKGWHFDEAHFDDIILSSPINKPNYNNKWNKFVARFDPDGNTIWANTISEMAVSTDYNQFDVDQQGNVYTGLMMTDTTYFGEEFLYLKTGAKDLIIARYTNDGDLDWVKSIKDSQSGNTYLTSVTCFNEKSLYVGGWFNDYLDFGSESLEVNNKNGFIGILGEAVGINQLYGQTDEDLSFKLFPNPAKQEVNIILDEAGINQSRLTVSDLTGRIVNSQMLTKSQFKTSIDVSDYAHGIYLVKIQSGKNTNIRKLVVD